MTLEWLEFAFIDNKRKFTSNPCRPAVNRLRANLPICHSSQFDECKLRNQGTNFCNQYDAQHSPTIVISSYYLYTNISSVENLIQVKQMQVIPMIKKNGLFFQRVVFQCTCYWHSQFIRCAFSSFLKYPYVWVCETLNRGPQNFCVNRVLDPPERERREEDRGETLKEIEDLVDVEKF